MSKVYLIGAGPLDDELVTIKAIRKLKQCTAVVYDRLIPKNLLNYVKEGCILHYVGKESGNHSKTQDEINSLIIKLAREGHVVGRLKGGDPYVFGRGGEEALRLKEEGIDFEVVPGVTSAISVLNYAGIPITHRGVSQGFQVFTGKSFDSLDIHWESLAKSNDTLVFLMGLNSLTNIKENLIQNGKSIYSKCAVIMNGTSSKQRKVIGTLLDILEKVEIAKLSSPCIIVIGDVIGFSEELNWYEKMPLFGENVCITRDRNYNESLKIKFKDLGAEVTEINTIKFIDLSHNIKAYKDKLCEYNHIIITSKNAASRFFNYLVDNNIDIRNLKARFYVSGKATAKTLRDRGIIPFFVSTSSKEGIFLKLREVAKEKEFILYPSSKKSIGSIGLNGLSKELNLHLDIVEIYDTVKNDIFYDIDFDDVDFIIFTSPSSVINFVSEYYKENIKYKKIIVIGETTMNEAKKYFNYIYISKEPTEESLIDEVIRLRRIRND